MRTLVSFLIMISVSSVSASIIYIFSAHLKQNVAFCSNDFSLKVNSKQFQEIHTPNGQVN